MAYSRWTTSRWYTFWASQSLNDENEPITKDEQMFAICDFGESPGFTYKQLTDDIDKCLQEVKEHYATERKGKMLTSFKTGTDDPVYEEVTYEPEIIPDVEMQELKLYMLNFIQDVDEDPDLL